MPSAPRRRPRRAPPRVAALMALLCGGARAFSPMSAVSAPPSSRGPLASSSPSPDEPAKKKSPLSRAYHIYADYAQRLWTETNTDARHKIADDKVRNAVLQMQNVVRSYSNSESKEKLLRASEELLMDIDKPVLEEAAKIASSKPEKMVPVPVPELAEMNEAAEAINGDFHAHANRSANGAMNGVANGATNGVANGDSEKQVVPIDPPIPTKVDTSSKKTVKKPKQQRSVLFGAIMGAVVAVWVFSGNYVFTGLFTLMTILGQLEYYRMVMNAGIYPARRISVVGACSMFLTALFAPSLHQICLPMFGLWSMIWFLTMRRQVSTISEIATTFTGMFYLGYVPSFWVRTRLVGWPVEPTRLAHIAGPFLEFINRTFGKHIPMPQGLIYLPITTGAKFIFWSWLCLAFSDVGGYFFGRAFGKTKLGAIAPAAGATSPNKTVEGVVGGCAVSAALGMLGAWVQKWPYWGVTGCVHGVLLGLLGLIGDLTASMLKRDAGLKDFGDLIPEHGGIMDRVDSFIWTAPYSWLVCAYIIPALKTFAMGR